MRSCAFAVLLSFYSLSFPALGEILETPSMEVALRSADHRTLVVLDLDNTVMKTRQMLGSDAFFGYLMGLADKRGLRGAEALNWALVKMGPIQPYSPVLPAEPDTAQLISHLQSKGVRIFALTSRPGEWAEPTLKQLASIGVDFSLTAPEVHSNLGRYLGGAFFLNPAVTKGEALLSLLRSNDLGLKRVLFVDDKLRHVQSVENSLANSGFEHLSVRYGAVDAEVEKFDPEVAQCEWNLFTQTGRFVPDPIGREALFYGKCN